MSYGAQTGTIVDVLHGHAAQRPDKVAFRFVDKRCQVVETLTFAELDRRAREIGESLVERGLGGRRVVLAFGPGLEIVASLIGCFHAGATAVIAPATDHRRGVERLRAILDDADAACLLVGGPTGASGVDGPIARIEARDLTGAAGVVPPAISASDLAVLQYTSGSTGNPRAVMISHANIMHNERAIFASLDGSPDDSAVCWLPLYHDMGLIGGVLQASYAGSTCTMMSPLDFLQRPLRWLQAIATFGATVSMAPSFAYELCARYAGHADVATLDLSSWRAAICGGETVRPNGLDRFADAFAGAGFDRGALFPAYGLAESTLMATSVRCGEGVRAHAVGARRLAACGRPWFGQQVAIVDPSSSRRVRDGEAGEVWLSGPSVALGYWRRPEATERAFGARIADEPGAGQWLRTGDLGLISPDGLIVTGRIKDLIIVRGANLDPQDIEQAIVETPEMADAAAFAIEDDDTVRVVAACEVRRESLLALPAADLIGAITARVSHSFGLTMHDLVFVRPGALPRTTSGKVQRHLCREHYLGGRLAAFAAVDHPSLGRCRPTPAA